MHYPDQITMQSFSFLCRTLQFVFGAGKKYFVLHDPETGGHYILIRPATANCCRTLTLEIPYKYNTNTIQIQCKYIVPITARTANSRPFIGVLPTAFRQNVKLTQKLCKNSTIHRNDIVTINAITFKQKSQSFYLGRRKYSTVWRI